MKCKMCNREGANLVKSVNRGTYTVNIYRCTQWPCNAVVTETVVK